MQGIEAAQVAFEAEPGRPLDEFLVYLHHAKGRPFLEHPPGGAAAGGEPHSPESFDEPDAADVPGIHGLHRSADNFAARFRHVPLDQRAGVQVKAQRSTSRSESTSSDARSEEVASRGARSGRLRAGGTTRPAATS